MPFSSRTMRPEDWAEIDFFLPSEFRSPAKMGYEFMRWLDRVRKAADVPMIISSSYRSPTHNESIGGAKNSAHMRVPCNAIDIVERPRADDPSWNYTRFRIMKAALDNGCVRIGTYADGSLHLDREEGALPSPRMWRVVK